MKYILLIIFTLIFQSIFRQKIIEKESYSEYLNNHPLGSISDRYHLTLTGYFDDCGEFGGHNEIIILKRKNRKLVATITIYEKDCHRRSGYEEIKVIEKKSYNIPEEKVSLFTNYLEKLLYRSIKNSLPFHAGRHYYATLDFEGKETQFRNIDLHYHDTGWSWEEFENLKNAIKK